MEERSKQGQTNNKAQQHSTPKAVTFPEKNELPRVGFVHGVERQGKGSHSQQTVLGNKENDSGTAASRTQTRGIKVGAPTTEPISSIST